MYFIYFKWIAWPRYYCLIYCACASRYIAMMWGSKSVSNNQSVSTNRRIGTIQCPEKWNDNVQYGCHSNTEVTACNCRSKETCPLPRNCLATNVIYKAEVTTTNDMSKKHYIGMTAGLFKLHYNQGIEVSYNF